MSQSAQATALNISPTDHLRDGAFHAHADLRVAVKMLRRFRLVAAWQRAKKGYERLGMILEWSGEPDGD